MHEFTWDSLIIQFKIIHQVTFVVSIPNIWGMNDKLVIECWQL